MSLHRSTRPRLVTTLVALTLFLFGSNFCLVGAFAGPAAVACHADPSASPAHSCCRTHPAKAARGPAAPASNAPCCMSMSQVVAPEVAKQSQSCPHSADVIAEIDVEAGFSPTQAPARSDARLRPDPFPLGPLGSRAPPVY